MNNNHATKTLASTFGVLVGLAGLEHGIFEIFQGNIAPNDIMIDAIGPAQKFWEYTTETALTILPNFLVTGIFATIFGLSVTIWASIFIDKKYGAWVFGLLSFILWLVGGGFAPIFMSILAFAAATRINNPLKWWRTHLSPNLRSFLSRLWPWSIVIYVIIFVISVEIQIFGYPLLWIFEANITYTIQWTLALIMVMLWPVTIITAFAHDVEKNNFQKSLAG